MTVPQVSSGEKVLLQIHELVLTTHRVRLKESIGWGNIELTSIMLGEVTSCRIGHRSKAIFLVITAIVLIASLILSGINQNAGYLLPGLVIAGLMVAMYCATRGGILIINATRDAIRLPFIRTSLMEIEKFVDTLEAARSRADSFES